MLTALERDGRSVRYSTYIYSTYIQPFFLGKRDVHSMYVWSGMDLDNRCRVQCIVITVDGHSRA